MNVFISLVFAVLAVGWAVLADTPARRKDARRLLIVVGLALAVSVLINPIVDLVESGF